jgi:hypothetical protein
MRYVAKITFPATVENPMVRLSFFEEIHFTTGPQLQAIGVVSHVYRKTIYKGDHLEVDLYERAYDAPRKLFCGGTEPKDAIIALEGERHKVTIECIVGNHTERSEFAIFPAPSSMPYEEIVDVSKLVTEINPHRRPVVCEVKHS